MAMKVTSAALALSVLAVSFAAAQIQVKEAPPVAAEAPKAPRAETTGGEPRNPEPHIYKLGEHLSEAYGNYEIVDNWQQYRLMAPPQGHHWVRYGENYMLVTATDGLIKRIQPAS
jgi:Ni/Co efflux regulator RcnB